MSTAAESNFTEDEYLLLVINDDRWQGKAVCQGTDPEAFFPESIGWKAEKSKYELEVIADNCAPCDVKRDCLITALKTRGIGIWGATTERERKKLLKEYDKDGVITINSHPFLKAALADTPTEPAMLYDASTPVEAKLRVSNIGLKSTTIEGGREPTRRKSSLSKRLLEHIANNGGELTVSEGTSMIAAISNELEVSPGSLGYTMRKLEHSGKITQEKVAGRIKRMQLVDRLARTPVEEDIVIEQPNSEPENNAISVSTIHDELLTQEALAGRMKAIRSMLKAIAKSGLEAYGNQDQDLRAELQRLQDIYDERLKKRKIQNARLRVQEVLIDSQLPMNHDAEIVVVPEPRLAPDDLAKKHADSSVKVGLQNMTTLQQNAPFARKETPEELTKRIRSSLANIGPYRHKPPQRGRR